MTVEMARTLLEGLRRDPGGQLRAVRLRIMPNKRYSAGAGNLRFIDVDHNELQGIYEIKVQATAFDGHDDGPKVQYLPWYVDSGIYILLQPEPDVFLTDKLTGCFLAFDPGHPLGPKISHLNFQNYKDEDKRDTLESYGHCHVLCPEDYRGDTTVFGIRKPPWEFFYQVMGGRSGSLSMREQRNRYGTLSVVPT